MATTANISVLIVAKPGRLRDSLKALLRTVTYLDIVDQVDDACAALPLVAQCHPNLLLVGSNLPKSSVATLITTTKTRSPQTRCMVLVDNMDQLWQAKAAGADSVLLAGFPSTTFFSTIEGLLPQPNIQ